MLVLGWRNWQTRMVEVHMEQSLGVQVPPRVPFLLIHEKWKIYAYIAQSVEHILGKDEVSGSSPDVGSIFNIRISFSIFFEINKTKS